MKKKKIYEGKIIGLNLYDLTIEKRKVRREIIEHPGAAAIIAFDEKGRIILVKQHRFGHGYILEIPAGTLEKGEKPIDTAYREIVEETGYEAKKMTKLISFFPSVGYNTEEIHVFVASGLKKKFELDLDNDEFISVIADLVSKVSTKPQQKEKIKILDTIVDKEVNEEEGDEDEEEGDEDEDE